MAGKTPRSDVRAALVGQGISRSLTPAMHEAEGRALGLNYSYDIVDTNSASYLDISLREIIQKSNTDGFSGLNITHPYKVKVIQYLDELSDNARMLGAVNTVIFRDGKSIGYNTDYSGFSTAFRQGLGDAPKDKVLLLGAGGAGSAVGFALLDCGAHNLIIHDIEPARAKELRQKLLARHPKANITSTGILNRSITHSLSGIVNATPIGMDKYPGSAFPLELLCSETWVADIVYFPLETKLLAFAGALGCRVMSGAGMAISQAVHSFELFTGQPGNTARFAAEFGRLIKA